MNPVCQPIIAGAPSVVTDTSFSSSTFFSTKNSFTALQMSTPLVVVFRGSSVKSSSFVKKLSKIVKKQNQNRNHQTLLIKTISCAALLLSTDSTPWMLNHLHLARSRSSWPAKFPDIAGTLPTTVVAPS